jgi:acyl-CoA synthetase (NDP forming)
VCSLLIASLRAKGRRILLEHEGYALLQELGIEVPKHQFVKDASEARPEALGSERVVVKVVSPTILHKSELGGVAVVEADRGAIASAIAAMKERLASHEVAGYLICERVEHDASLGGELLFGMRWTPDFGPVVTFGLGGLQTELYAQHMGAAILSPFQLGEPERIRKALSGRPPTRLVTEEQRGREPRMDLDSLVGQLQRWLAFAKEQMPSGLAELEVNPAVFRDGRLVALDVVAKLNGEAPVVAERPIGKLEHLLRPHSMAIIGVSERVNPGRIILENTLRQGFDKQRIYILKEGRESLLGCSCFPDVASLPERVDLFVLSVAATQVPGLVREIVEEKKAESVIIIPGGLGEKGGTEDLVAGMVSVLRESRRSDWKGPLLNGGNCLGVRSKPGRYDTLFIPDHKLPVPDGDPSPLALISQSGAFAVARASKLSQLDPRYIITVGNQVDLTVGDYLTYLKDDPDLKVFACYVEGFKPLDGLKFLDAAAEITASGRTVILYRSGRTPAGASASASHTASIAGDYAVTRELAQAAGAVVAETLGEFDDYVRIFSGLHGKRVGGWRLGAISNAGFECVAMADNTGRFELARLGAGTARALQALFERCRLERILEVRNPLDVTPIMDDASFAEAALAILEDPGVDVGLIGCVPLTGAMSTLTRGSGHGEDVTGAESVAGRLKRLKEKSEKPWVAVVDAGPLYDPMAAVLEAAGVPTFRTADRALRLFEVFCRTRATTD